jgi:hypothetical protein
MSEQDWDAIKEEIYYDYTQDSYLSEAKQAEIMRNRIDLLNQIQPYVGTYFSREFIYSDVLHMDEEEIAEIKKDIDNDTDLQQQMAMQQTAGAPGGTPAAITPAQAKPYNPSNPQVESLDFKLLKSGS